MSEPTHGAIEQEFCVVCCTERLSHVRDRPIVVRVFHGFADGFLFCVGGNVSELSIKTEAAVIIRHRAFFHQRIDLP